MNAPNSTRRTRLAALAVVVLLAIGGGLWWWSRPAPTAIPAIPAEIEDADVRKLLDEYREKVDASPRSSAAWGELGLAFLANLFDREADRCFAEAARLDPDDARWPYARAVIALKRDPGNAVSLLRQAAAAPRPGPEYRATARLLLAEALLERNELTEAERIFSDEASDARAMLGLGLVARARGDAAAAGKYLVAAQSSPNARRQATIQLIALARARGDETAAAALERDLATLPDDRGWPDPMVEEIARLRVGRRARERTIDEFEKEKRFDEAAAEYLRQIEVHPTVQAYTGAAVNLARLQEYDRAVELLRDAIRLDAENSQAHYTLALVQFTRAEKEAAQSSGSPAAKEWFREAVASGRRATELKPDHAMAFLMWGLALKHLGDPAAAIDPLRKGVVCRPDLLGLQLALGEALLETGQFSEAETHLNYARRLAPNDPRTLQALERLKRKR